MKMRWNELGRLVRTRPSDSGSCLLAGKMSSVRNVWLDCDPGHDDAMAILLALNLSGINLLGISSVHGNAILSNTTANAARCLCSFGSEEQIERVKLVEGAQKPLLGKAIHDPGIHGEDGLGGVEGLFAATNPLVQGKIEGARSVNVLSALVDTCNSLGANETLTLVVTGAQTNIALFCAGYPDLVRDKIDEIVFMGGAEGRGNRSSLAEFNIMCDPEACQIILDSEVKVVMIPLNVTHMAIFGKEDHKTLLDNANGEGTFASGARTQLRHTLSTLLMFFAEAYETTFGFKDGPPVHDALCIAYLTNPELFKGTRYRVDVELSGSYARGATVVDVFNYRESEGSSWGNGGKLERFEDENSKVSWGQEGKNCWVAEDLNVAGFWGLVMQAVAHADQVSLINK